MDKYEFNTRIDQIKKAVLKKDFKTAARTADMIDWAKVKNNSILMLVADAYEADKQYEKAKEVLLIAYKRAPMGRQLAYRLSILSVKMKDFVDAEEFYTDFTQIAPSDTAAYILKYRIAKERGESTEALIQILEAYNEVDMEEKWAYCLAKLYDQIGDKERCVSLCDEISLWFNEGVYVIKALKLKQKYTQLTRGQEERLNISETKKTPEIKIKEFSGNGSDTIDIQETIAKSMEVLMSDSEKSPEGDAATDKDKTSEDNQKDKLGNTNSVLNPIYRMEGDGQISLDVEEDEKKIEKQITGQLDITEVLRDLESRGILNKNTVTSTVDAMDKATSVVEQAKVETEEYLSVRRTSSLIDAIEQISDDEDIDEIVNESETEEPNEEIVVDDIIEADGDNDANDSDKDIEIYEEIDDESDKWRDGEVKSSRINTADLQYISDALENMKIDAEDIESVAEAGGSVDVGDIKETTDNENISGIKESADSGDIADTEEAADATNAEDIKEIMDAEDTNTASDSKKVSAGKGRLSEDDAGRFAGFLTITGLEERLADTIASLTDTSRMDGTSAKNNVVIMGDGKSGKTTLAIDLIKLINEKRGRTGRRIAKVNAVSLNSRGFASSLNKLLKCDLIIEDAAKLDNDIIDEIEDAGKYYTDDMIIILEDLSPKMKDFMDQYPELNDMFGNRIVLKEFSLREWLNYAEDYAEKIGYALDPVGRLALAHTIDEIYGINQGIEKEDVQEIIDNAVEKHNKKIGRKFARMFGGRSDELDLEILKEKDFI